jgi:hypothetical protein
MLPPERPWRTRFVPQRPNPCLCWLRRGFVAAAGLPSQPRSLHSIGFADDLAFFCRAGPADG